MKILLFGDTPGISQLLRHLPCDVLAGIAGASIRPQYIEDLQALTRSLRIPFLLQPKWKSDGYDAFLDEVRALAPDLIWVNSYSMILREEILDCAPLGGINIHGALLPKYRGCNPTQWAILNEETETGVTMHEMTAGIDEGAIIDQRVVPLFFEDTWQAIRERIIKITDNMIKENLPKILEGRWNVIPQDENQADYFRRRTPDDGLFDWGQPVVAIYNLIRALLPPLPPAFYVDESGNRVYMSQPMTPAGVTALKYGLEGGGRMEGERIRLRPLQKKDSALLYDWITRRDMVILNAPYYPVSDAAHEAWMESMLSKQMDVVLFVIEDLEVSQAIGTCQLLNINWIHRSAELQIRIGDDTCYGQGFGSEAVRLLCQFGFTDLNLHRIYLHVFANNRRAIHAYEKCGFTKEGTMKEAAFIDGEWVDVHVMGLIKTMVSKL